MMTIIKKSKLHGLQRSNAAQPTRARTLKTTSIGVTLYGPSDEKYSDAEESPAPA
jgi:hypothetical protein